MDILWNIKNIFVRICRLLITIVFCFVATDVAEAKTINNSNTYANSSYIEMFDNMFARSGYNNYLLSVETIKSGYNSYDYYYFCLTDNVEYTNQLYAKGDCKEMYLYSRTNSEYLLEKVNDNYLEVNNSVYYTSNVYDTDYVVNRASLAILLALLCFYITFILLHLFGV